MTASLFNLGICLELAKKTGAGWVIQYGFNVYEEIFTRLLTRLIQMSRVRRD